MSLATLTRTARRGLAAVVLAAGLALGGTAAAWAVETGWTVAFDGKAMKSDGTADMLAQVSKLQPGDSVVFNIDLFNDFDQAADWYMKTEVLRTMEELADNGGGSYAYDLTYTSPAGEKRVIYTNDTVSGDSDKDDTNGLFDATGAMREMFFLDTLPADSHAAIVMSVSLDPESHGNSYFDTAAKLQISFAAEPKASNNVPPTETKTDNPPKADDPADQPKKDEPTDLLSRLAQTGDAVMIAVVGLAAVAVIAGGLLCVARRRSHAKEEGETR